MDERILKEINYVKKRLNEVEQKLENFLLDKHKDNAEAIAVSEEAVMDLAAMISEIVETKED